MSDLVGNPEDWFSHVTAHIVSVNFDQKAHIELFDFQNNTVNTEIHVQIHSEVEMRNLSFLL